MCPVYGTSCNFISEKHRGWSQESLLITTNSIRSKNGSVLSIPRPPLSRWSWNLKKLKVELVLSFSPPSAPRPIRTGPPSIYPPSSTNSMLHTDELGVMEQAQIKRNASKCGAAAFVNNYLSALQNEADIALIKGACIYGQLKSHISRIMSALTIP